MTGIKTIIFTTNPYNNATYLNLSYANSNTTAPNSNTWISACSVGCNFGTNDFTAAPLIIGAIRWSFPTYTIVAICEIWAY